MIEPFEITYPEAKTFDDDIPLLCWERDAAIVAEIETGNVPSLKELWQ